MMASPLPAQSSRASSPMSTISDLDPHRHQDSKTFDDLTLALANFSRAQTPDAPAGCCCMRENCESMRTWADVRAKLESRLVLSAEVGQALLQRYEAYVRKQDTALSREASSIFLETPDDARQQVEILMKKLDTVTEENAIMESRIQELVIKTEISEATTKTLKRELKDVRAVANRLASQQSRSAGWEFQLAQQMQERDDMRQERDAVIQREKQMATKLLAAEEKSAALLKEVNSLRGELKALRASRSQFSKSVFQEAKSHIEVLRDSMNPTLFRDDPETFQALESLVTDNEGLKQQIIELNMLLSEARDEVEEVRVEIVEAKKDRWDGGDNNTSVVPSPTRIAKSFESELGFDTKLTHTPSPWSRKGRIWSQAVQTDPVTILPLSPPQYNIGLRSCTQQQINLLSPRSSTLAAESTSSHDLHSETSSLNLSDARNSSSTVEVSNSGDAQVITPSDPRPLSTITNRVSGLLARMLQADVRTLTLRLKRQNLLGDPRQVSEVTIKAIVSEAAGLRIGREEAATPPRKGGSQLREDMSTRMVSRSELKSLLRLFRELFAELGALRAQLNNVIFDPVLAQKLRKEALDSAAPSKPSLDALSGKEPEKDRVISASWMTPIQKLFGQSTAQDPRDSANAKQPRIAPKQAPAVAATPTTVNVEFSGGGVRGIGTFRTIDAPPGSDILRPPSARPMPQILAPTPSRSLMGIFAGAPQPTPTGDRWTLLPRNITREKEKDRVKQLRDATSNAEFGPRLEQAGTIGRSNTSYGYRSSRRVDAVLVPTEPLPDFRETLLQRTLRPRGLSDSSIHTTFLKEEPKPPSEPETVPNPPISPTLGSPLSKHRAIPTNRVRSPTAKLGGSWVPLGGAGAIFGSPREEPNIHQTAWARRGLDAD